MGNDHLKAVADEKKTIWGLAALSALVGAAVFLAIYGIRVLDVTNDSWLRNNYMDMSGHYTGWIYYRKTPWQFPLGLIEGLVYPNKVSIVYMDSIPLFALFFKVLSPILPETFQYFGIYGLITYMLQSALGSVLIYSRTKNRAVSLIGSVFFVLSSVLTQRMYTHSALAFHPVILASMLLYFNRHKVGYGWKSAANWTLIYVVACSVHAYLVPMVLAFQCAYYLKKLFSRKWYMTMVRMAIPVAVLLGMMYIWGYFYGVSNFGDGGLGAYSADLNTLIDDQGTSWFTGLFGKIASTGMNEGYSYLGFGVILLGIIDTVVIVMNWRAAVKKIDISTILLLCVFVCAATFPVFRLGGRVLLELPLPGKIVQLCSTFRTNGRFMWPALYMITFGIIVSTCRLFRKNAPFLLLLAAVIQIVDMHPLYRSKSDSISAYFASPSILSSPVWDELDKDEVYYLYEPSYSTNPQCKALAYYAYANDMVISDYLVSRKNSEMIAGERQREIESILQGEPDPDMLYVFNDVNNPAFAAVPMQYLLYDTNLNVYEVDGSYIGVTDELPDAQAVSLENGIELLKYLPPYITSTNGADISGHTHTDSAGAHLHANETMQQALTLPYGTYLITLEGDNLNNLTYELVSNTDTGCELSVLRDEDESVQLKADISASLSATQLLCSNTGIGEVLFTSIELKGYEAEYVPYGIKLGERIGFTASSYSAGQYIVTGVCGPEENFSWTYGNVSEFRFNLPANSGSVRGNIDLYDVFNGSQTVEVYVNGELVNTQVQQGGGTVAFDFMCPEDGAVALELVLPDAVSPLELGQSTDDRALSLAITGICFERSDTQE